MKLLLVLLCLHRVATGLKILALFPFPGPSHYAFFEPIIRGLWKNGHEMTVIGHFPQRLPVDNITYIVLKEEIWLEFLDIKDLPDSKTMAYQGMMLLESFVDSSCKTLLSKEVQEFMKTKEKFDIILIESFVADCYLGFVEKFKVPFIGLSSAGYLSWEMENVGIPNTISHVPQCFMMYSDKMNFLQRVKNLVMYLYNDFQYERYVPSRSNYWAKKAFGTHFPNVRDIARNISMQFVNTHFTLHRPKTIPPNLIEIGGLTIKAKKAIPENLEKWINESEHGVIYLSMGSMIKGHSFPPETRAAFIRAFDRLPQRVLWKWENETLPGKTDKIMIQKWMPQFDILCHPKVKGYISHGGLLGTTEAVHCGVPAVVLPQYGDQFVNAAALEAGGGGLVLDFKTVTEDKIYEALKKIIDPKFKKQAEELSARFRDRPMPPLETAIYWVEYVARHGGAHHMKTAAVGMPWYQYLLFDVIAFLAAVLITLLTIIYFCIRTILRLVFKKVGKSKAD